MAAPTRMYQDFEPSTEWITEDECDTLLLYLPGFAKDQLRVQLRSRNLIISGERKLQHQTWTRFRKEFPVSANCDVNKISAKFEGNILFVRQPKLITPAVKPPGETEPAPASSTPQKPLDQPQKPAQDQIAKPPVSKPQENGATAGGVKPEEAPKTGSEEKKGSSTVGTHESNHPQGVRENAAENTKGVREYAAESTKDVRENAAEKTEGGVGDAKRVQEEEVDRTSKRALESYKRAVGGLVTKIKTSRTAVHTVLVLLLGLVLGVYVSNFINSWKTFGNV